MPRSNARPEAAIARFQNDLAALIAPGSRIGIAVSGGPDSLALLLLAHATLPGRIAATTVDHGLRAESADEAAMVAGVCKHLGVAHVTLAPVAPLLRAGNISERARILRYRLLADWAESEGLRYVAVAHHRDDVAESFLMRALKGAGVKGLARMAAAVPIPYGHAKVTLIRPLLGWSRAELATIPIAAGLSPVDDPSNRNKRYDRARIRALLAAEPMLDPEQLARAATNLAEAEAALEWLTDQAWRSRGALRSGAETEIDPTDLPREIRRRLVGRAILDLAPSWDGEGLDGLVDRLDAGNTATLAGICAGGGKIWRFRIAPTRTTAR